jgi:hypothetical protein
MVPSGGFSPQPFHDSGYTNNGNNNKYCVDANYGSTGMVQIEEPYGNLAETFDLSLLGDAYDDHDMATVPSPMVSLESNCHQMSFYAASPSSEFRAFSPECMKSFNNNNGGGEQQQQQHHLNGSSNNNNNNGPLSNGHNLIMMCNNNAMLGDNGNSTLESSLSPSNDVGGDCGRNVLLRQCLEDTTFQSKYNIKPVDLPTITINEHMDDMMVCIHNIISNSLFLFLQSI